MDSKKWKVRSPDWNPLYFFMWGYMESKAYRVGNPAGRRQLVEDINGADDGYQKQKQVVAIFNGTTTGSMHIV